MGGDKKSKKSKEKDNENGTTGLPSTEFMIQPEASTPKLDTSK